jgi:hypothetical protein
VFRGSVVIIGVVGGCGFTPGTADVPDPSTDPADAAIPDDAATPDAAAPDARVCGAAYVAVADAPPTSRYKIVNPSFTVDHSAATADCAADGTHLFIPDVAGEGAAMWTRIEAEIPGLPYTSQDTGFYRVGVTRVSLEAPWIDQLGDVFVPDPDWGSFQPDNLLGDLCMLVGDGGKLYDTDCSQAREYACECD